VNWSKSTALKFDWAGGSGWSDRAAPWSLTEKGHKLFLVLSADDLLCSVGIHGKIASNLSYLGMYRNV
jgi:hypothetical protein